MTRLNEKSITIREVARHAGVSIATVSRYINNTTPVSDDVAHRVQGAMTELHFVPHAVARKLATMRTNTIGLLLSDIQGDFFAPILSGIENIVRQSGYDLLISTSIKQLRKAHPLPLGPHNVDGMLVFVNSLEKDVLSHYFSLGFPMVLIHQSAPQGMNIPCVTVENKAATQSMINHLIEAHGRRQIVFLSGPQDEEDANLREMGYLNALQAYQIPFNPGLVAPGEFDRHVARDLVLKLVAEGIPFDAIFSGDDEAAVGVLEALHAVGKKVPEDVSVVGFDDQRLSLYLNPSLTTVRAPTYDVGLVAAQQLMKLIQNEQVEPLVLLPTEMIIRQSCGCGIRS